MKKKTVLISGASRGLGSYMARVFAKNNYNVVINYFEHKKEAYKVLEEITKNGGSAIVIKADVRIKEEVHNMVETVKKIFGHIDVLINNAGIAQNKLFIDYEEEDYNNVFNTNFRGIYYLTKEILPQMISNQKGKIINITSIWGQTGGAYETLYSATKGAIIAFTKALAKEYALANITVNAISPGVFDTDIMKAYTKEDYDNIVKKIPMERAGEPIEVGHVALFLASDEANYITGQVLPINGGLYC